MNSILELPSGRCVLLLPSPAQQLLGGGWYCCCGRASPLPLPPAGDDAPLRHCRDPLAAESAMQAPDAPKAKRLKN